MNYDDEYEQFDDFNYDDVAEDWEAEAEQEEQNAIAEEVARAARKREKLNVRAPEAQEVDEEPLPAEIQAEITSLRSEAQQYRESDVTGTVKETLISSMPANTADDMKAIADTVAAIVEAHKNTANYKDVMELLSKSLINELKDTLLLNKEITRMTFLAKKINNSSSESVDAHRHGNDVKEVDIDGKEAALTENNTSSTYEDIDDGMW